MNFYSRFSPRAMSPRGIGALAFGALGLSYNIDVATEGINTSNMLEKANTAYRIILNREPDQAGAAFWARALTDKKASAGLDDAQLWAWLVQQFMATDEYKSMSAAEHAAAANRTAAPPPPTESNRGSLIAPPPGRHDDLMPGSTAALLVDRKARLVSNTEASTLDSTGSTISPIQWSLLGVGGLTILALFYVGLTD